MWQYNYDYLCHSSSHKYIDKYKSKSGKTIYVYDAKYVANHPISSINKKTLAPSSGLRTNKNATTTRSGIKQIAKDKQYVDQYRQIQNAKAAEKEHSSKTEDMDREQAYQRRKEAALEKYNTTKDNFKKAITKFDDLLNSKNVRQADLNEASKYMESYLDDYDEMLQETSKQLRYNDYISLYDERRELHNQVSELRKKSGLERFKIGVGDPLPNSEKWYGKKIYSTYFTSRVRR